MKITLFYHSVISDWNHGNAHFLRGIISSFLSRNHTVQIMEPEKGWSLQNLLNDKGLSSYFSFNEYFPQHTPILYNEECFDPEKYLYDTDVVIVHEWNNPGVVKKIGKYKETNKRMILLFHDTHHRSVTQPEEMLRYDLRNYDGVLAFGETIRKIYLRKGWAKNVWTWHEAADKHIFYPHYAKHKEGDLVWIGNWGDNERTEELQEFIIKPVVELGLKACFYGVRYPQKAIQMLHRAKIEYKGWLPNHMVPEIFSRYRVTVHVPRRPYVTSLPGIPTIRPFEALACGIPLICSPWDDSEKLFTPGKDYLVAQNSSEMKEHLMNVLHNPDLENSLVKSGLDTILRKHTCDHRVDSLIRILNDIDIKNNGTTISSEPVVHQNQLNYD